MSYLAPLARDNEPSLENVYSAHEHRSGFVPNGFLIMSRNPDFIQAYHAFTAYTLAGGTVGQPLKYLCAMVASDVAGCVYCQTHLAIGLRKNDVPMSKVRDAIRARENAASLSPVERDVVALAHAAASQPAQVTSAQLDALIRDIGNEGLVEIATLIAQFGFLYRYNGMVGSRIELPALEHARQEIQPAGWNPGIHDPAAKLMAEGRGDGTALLAERARMAPDVDAAARWTIASRLAGASADPAEPLFLASINASPKVKALYLGVSEAIRETSTIAPYLGALAESVASLAAGSRYDQARTILEAKRACASERQLGTLWSFETSDAFSPAERVALRFAMNGAIQPQDISTELHASLREHYSERDVVDLTIHVAWIAVRNRWNLIFGTPVEADARDAAQRYLAPQGWCDV